MGDTVDDEVLGHARDYYIWKKLFLGLPDVTAWNIRRSRREDYLDDQMDLGTFEQVPDLDYDTPMNKRPARCRGCQPSVRTSSATFRTVNTMLVSVATIVSIFLAL